MQEPVDSPDAALAAALAAVDACRSAITAGLYASDYVDAERRRQYYREGAALADQASQALALALTMDMG